MSDKNPKSGLSESDLEFIATKIFEKIKESSESFLSNSDLDYIAQKIFEKLDEAEQDPYSRLTRWSTEAMEDLKKDIKQAFEENNDRTSEDEINSIQARSNAFQKTLNESISKLDKMIKADSTKKTVKNPFQKEFAKKEGRLSLILNPFKKHSSGARNWLGLLLIGTGIVLIWRGIWDTSYAILSNQGSIVIGAVILIIVAFMEKSRVFAIFGEE